MLRALPWRAKEFPPVTTLSHAGESSGWLHFSEDKGRYLAVRQSTGGGTRSISLPGTSGTSDIIDEARNLFFPQGESTFGSWLDMDYNLANFSGEKIDKLTTPEGKEIEFSLQLYFNLYKLTRVRLYLKTKRKEQFSEETKVGEVRNSRLLGSSQERAQLKEKQDEKYEESLRIDRAKQRQKEEALMEEISGAKKVEEIHAARLGRVLEEPGIDVYLRKRNRIRLSSLCGILSCKAST